MRWRPGFVETPTYTFPTSSQRRLHRSRAVTRQRGEIEPDVAAAALVDLAEFPFERHADDHLLPRVWQLRDNLTAYDAIYVVLAELLDAPLLTLDAALAISPGHDAVVELVR